MPEAQGVYIRDLDAATTIAQLLAGNYEFEQQQANGAFKSLKVSPGLLLQFVGAYLAGPNNRRDLLKAVPDEAGRTALATDLLCLNTTCYVESPAAIYRLQRDATGPLSVFQDGSFSGGKVAARWVPVVVGGGEATPFTITPTVSDGGIQAGTTYTNVTSEDLWRLKLELFQAPSFNNSLRVQGADSATYKVGTQFPQGFKSVTWSTSNSGNVQANSLTFRDVTGNTVLASAEANDGTLSASTTAFTITKGVTRVFLLSGLDTKGNAFFDDVTYSGLFASTFGYLSTQNPTFAQLLNLGNERLQDGRSRTIGGVMAGTGLYTVYAWEDNAGNDDVAQILQDGVDSIRGAFREVRRLSGQNELGAAVTMAYIVSNATQAFTNSTLEFK
ncbi:hypothetical protein MUN82_08675 [Hymenobacter aerilatus]|uniref:Uncharacterized protein n=1 Tax=Hymenobacter aerilatus TaxID=2932251 RepID=A0A8T9T4X7_9BACT|nr:hypothetical protein [Hymenobacter aerilatus]UOR07156.1 hypothetical protein MUN82_08675 [Hymenobacter aerilatus]